MLILGPAGTGKSLLGLSFVSAAIQRDAPATQHLEFAEPGEMRATQPRDITRKVQPTSLR